jgi:Leucine-rich repeat (LRR) protein
LQAARAVSYRTKNAQGTRFFYRYNDIDHISLKKNSFTSFIPLWICGFGKLTRFNLASNNFDGNIPECIGSLNQLEIVSLSGNELSGELPSEICDLIKLESLRIDENRIMGIILSSNTNKVLCPNASVDSQDCGILEFTAIE